MQCETACLASNSGFRVQNSGVPCALQRLLDFVRWQNDTMTCLCRSWSPRFFRTALPCVLELRHYWFTHDLPNHPFLLGYEVLRYSLFSVFSSHVTCSAWECDRAECDLLWLRIRKPMIQIASGQQLLSSCQQSAVQRQAENQRQQDEQAEV